MKTQKITWYRPRGWIPCTNENKTIWENEISDLEFEIQSFLYNLRRNKPPTLTLSASNKFGKPKCCTSFMSAYGLAVSLSRKHTLRCLISK